MINKFALEDPLPRVLTVFTKSESFVPVKYFSVNSLFTIFDFSWIKLIIESVIFSLVPLGITRSIETLSEAICGKNEVLIIPPPKDPIVRTKNDINNDITRKRFFNEKTKKGE